MSSFTAEKLDMSVFTDNRVMKKKYFYLCGFRTWNHYKKAETLLTLNTIIADLKEAHLTGKPVSLLTEEDRKKLRQFNLYLYKKSPQ